MKHFFICTGLLFAATTLFAQAPPASPPETASVTINGKTITIHYNSPRVKGREGHIFTPGGLIQTTHKSYPVWRGGANTATTLILTLNITIGDLNVPAGSYTTFIDISNPEQWMFIVSKKTGEWGLAYDPTQDLGRTRITMAKPPALVEDLLYTLTDDGGGKGTLTLAWGT